MTNESYYDETGIFIAIYFMEIGWIEWTRSRIFPPCVLFSIWCPFQNLSSLSQCSLNMEAIGKWRKIDEIRELFNADYGMMDSSPILMRSGNQALPEIISMWCIQFFHNQRNKYWKKTNWFDKSFPNSPLTSFFCFKLEFSETEYSAEYVHIQYGLKGVGKYS